MSSFQRARRPDQINLRRKALLVAAAELFDAKGPAGAGLNAIAARAGFTKSNVYRYFESREDVLLALFLDEFDRLSDSIEGALPACHVGDFAAVAEAITACFIAQPRCCHLMSIFSGVLEQNVSEKTIIAVKRHLKTRNRAIVAALARRLPGTRLEDCGWAIAMTSALIAGMWPGAHPSPAAAAVLARPEFAEMILQPERDLRRAIAAFLSGILPGIS
jgi:TetR/AcrR family transcriptional regulator